MTKFVVLRSKKKIETANKVDDCRVLRNAVQFFFYLCAHSFRRIHLGLCSSSILVAHRHISHTTIAVTYEHDTVTYRGRMLEPYSIVRNVSGASHTLLYRGFLFIFDIFFVCLQSLDEKRDRWKMFQSAF